MKRILLIATLLSIVTLSYGQKKPKINAAYKALTENKLDEAKSIIDRAANFEKIKDNGKTWYYRGLIYASIDTTTNPAYQTLANDAVAEAMTSFAKADELAKGNSGYFVQPPSGLPVTMSMQIQGWYDYYWNSGAQAYNDANLDKAVSDFTKCSMIKPQDTTAYKYAGQAAQRNEDFKTAAKNYEKLINDLDYHDEDLYSSLFYIKNNVEKDKEAALAVIRKAKKHFPENTSFPKSEIDLLMSMDKMDEAKANLETEIKADPDNAQLYALLGNMQENLDQKDKAVESYKMGISKDADNLICNYNLGILYYNDGAAIIKEVNNMDMKTYQRMADTRRKDAVVEFEKALPYFEKVHQLQPKEKQVLNVLETIYANTKNDSKLKEIREKLAAIEQE